MLTAQDTRDLRTADDLVFETIDGESRIRAIFRATDRSSEVTVVIPVPSARTTDYQGGGTGTSVYVALSARHDPITASFTNMVKTGETLNFLWTRGNASPVTDAAGLVVDHLDVLIGSRTGSNRAVIRLGTSIGLDNSARMCR